LSETAGQNRLDSRCATRANPDGNFASSTRLLDATLSQMQPVEQHLFRLSEYWKEQTRRANARNDQLVHECYKLQLRNKLLSEENEKLALALARSQQVLKGIKRPTNWVPYHLREPGSWALR
jgi:hypothetical protein